jgi:hypothetical protein
MSEQSNRLEAAAKQGTPWVVRHSRMLWAIGMGLMLAVLLFILFGDIYLYLITNYCYSCILVDGMSIQDLALYTLLFAPFIFLPGLFVAIKAIAFERSVPAPALNGRLVIKKGVVVATVAAMIVLSGLFIPTIMISCFGGCGIGVAVPKAYDMASTGTSTLGTPATYTWALASCVTATPCNTYNFSVNASSGLTTNQFGLKITTTTGDAVTGWLAVIWSTNGATPLATWTPGSSSWTCLTSTCPVGGLQDTGLLIITPQGTVLTGTGDSLWAYGLGSNSVSGQGTF